MRWENAMKLIVGVIVVLVTFGFAALGLFAAQQLSSSPRYLVAGTVFADPGEGSIVPAVQPAGSATPTTSAAAANASAPAEPTSSAPPPIVSEQDRQSDAYSGQTGAATNGNVKAPAARSEVLGARSDLAPCGKPDAVGVARVIEIDTTGGPLFGLQHLKGHDILRNREVILTFDDGPHPVSTGAVLKALEDECVKATFFEIGQAASWHPEITKQMIDAGMTIGTHTWSHRDLAKKPYATDLEKAVQEIEMGNSALHMAAAGAAVAPFFRFPELQHSLGSLEYLAHRNIAVFSTDIDSRDFTMHRPEQVIDSVMGQLDRRGRGIILMHDSHRNTADALPDLLRRLKAANFKIVHIVPKEELSTIDTYDEMFRHHKKLSANVFQEIAVG
jgi:peptidoglycan/xylan/chitin deacetylase (PgdA/CDA1 family)